MSYLIEPESERRYDPGDWTFPVLVHGAAGSGASWATIVLAAELIRAGRSVVWLCQKPAAIRELQQELGLAARPPLRSSEVTGAVAAPLADSQLVTMHGSAEFLLRSLRALPDWNQRCVILKNIEVTLSAPLWNVLTDHRDLVLSGDCARTMVSIDPDRWLTMLGFSTWPRAWGKTDDFDARYIGKLYRQNGRSAILAIDRPSPIQLTP